MNKRFWTIADKVCEIGLALCFVYVVGQLIIATL